MKRRLLTGLMATAVIIASLTGCGKTEYTEEFSYLPEQDDMKTENYEEADEEKMATGTYTIENAKSEEVMEDYFKELEKDGWEITEDGRPTLLKAKKGEHEVVIVPTQNESSVTLTIVSK